MSGGNIRLMGHIVNKVYLRIRYRPATRGMRKTHPFEFANVYCDHFFTTEQHVRTKLTDEQVKKVMERPGMQWHFLSGEILL